MVSDAMQSNPQAVLVLPRLRIQNANAASSQMTHGFPAMTAFLGFMWAFERKLVAVGVPFHFHGLGVVCHWHQEQVAPGHVQTFNLTRNPLDEQGRTQSIVEEGRIHLDVTVILTVSVRTEMSGPFSAFDIDHLQSLADQAGEVAAQMRIAGGSVLPNRLGPSVRTRPWLAVLADDLATQRQQFCEWRREWLPGFALVGRDDLLAERLTQLRKVQPAATALDAWLHVSRFNYESRACEKDAEKAIWADPWRQEGTGWVVPLSVGYVSIDATHPPGSVANARDTSVPFSFVEPIYSLGQWVSPHRLEGFDQLTWHAETDLALGRYRCRNGYRADIADDDLDVYEYH